ncbi:MAG: response regulator [Bacteroidota bacterium]|nr:response regulator [Bacteroidota bacterium]
MDSKKILVFIVEDNEMYSMMLDYILTKESTHRFMRFNTGEKCVENLHLEPDIILLDYGLPGMDGLETIGKIKEYSSDIPVIIITANKNAAITQRLLDAGAYDYILKENDDIVPLIVETVENALKKLETSKKVKDIKKQSSLTKILVAVLIVTLALIGISMTGFGS